MSATGFAFANPRPSPDDFDTFNPQDVYADSAVETTPVTEAIPAPWKNPPVMQLADVLGSSAVQDIQNSGQIVFHSAGDTGGVKEPSHQFAVADAMTDDLTGKSYASGLPAFLFHLGDVVYFFGQERYYYDQFYDPYRDYAGPIFGIPGNHDGVLFQGEPVPYSLQPFYENFCSKQPSNDPAAKGFARTTMTQPGVYFTLNAPFIKIIGLYSNTSETTGVLSGGVVGTAQSSFLLAQLRAAAAQRNQKGSDPFALILAVHHPPFTISLDHFPSPQMLQEIDNACTTAGIWPDLVLSGHAHLYERYTRVMKTDGRQIPYLVAGNGGYFDLSKPKTGKNGALPKTGVAGNDGKGNELTLAAYNDNVFGFLRIAVDPRSIQCESLGVDETTRLSSVMDQFTLDLSKHTVGSTTPSKRVRKKTKAVTVTKKKVPPPGFHSRMRRKK
ncbi:MAG: metallophosphoesterase family protein [Candidatus Acidiferrales bacterium]